MWQISLPSLRSQYHKPASPSALQILSFPRVASSSPCPSAPAAGRYPAVTSLHGLWALHEAGFVSVYYGCAEAEPWPFALRFWCSWHCIQYRKQILCVASNDEKMSSMISRYLSSFQYHLCYFYPSAIPYTCLRGSQAFVYLCVWKWTIEPRRDSDSVMRHREEMRKHFYSISLVIFSNHSVWL